MEGTIAIFVNPRGDVIATACDFEKSGFGGFTLEQAQKIRCRNRINREIVSAYASPDLADNIESYTCERIVDDLMRKGFKLIYKRVKDSSDAPKMEEPFCSCGQYDEGNCQCGVVDRGE